jgi:hypothetical protein
MFAESTANANVHRLHAKQVPGGHFEYPISTSIHLPVYGMSSYLESCSLKTKMMEFIMFSKILVIFSGDETSLCFKFSHNISQGICPYLHNDFTSLH